MQKPSATFKQYVVLLLKPDSSSTSRVQTPLGGKLQDKAKSSTFAEGYFVMPKSKRDEEYIASSTFRKGSGSIKIKLPYHGFAGGKNFEVRGIDNKEFLCICKCQIRIDQGGILEDESNAAYSRAVQELVKVKSDNGHKCPPAVDPQRGMALHYEYLQVLFRCNLY